MKRYTLPEKYLAPVAILSWLIVNMFQAVCTNLHSDEVYYWTYSWKLQWTYWDNAPLIGVFIFIGDAIFPYTEIGVRLVSVLSGTLAIYLLWLCTDKRDPYLFFALLFGMALIHVGGFMAAPDAPLALANAVLLLMYKKFTLNSNKLHAILLGLAAAMVMYSKYQGALLIAMLAVSNLRLFIKKEMWIAIIVFLVAITPEFIAVYKMDFSTLQYHLSDKNPESWNWNWTTDFIAGQFLAAGPFVGFILLPVLFIHKPKDVFLRSMRFSAIGVYMILLALTFKVYVFGNWSAPALFPLLLIGYDGLQARVTLRRWGIRTGLAGLILACIARIYIIMPLPLPKTLTFHFKSWESWAQDMHTIADNKPVIFFNTYQLPARYAFYNHTHNVYTLTNFDYHPTQFDYSGIEDNLQGKEVFLVSGYNFGASDSVIDVFHGNYYLFPISRFCSAQQTQIHTDKKTINALAGQQITIPVTILPSARSADKKITCSDYQFYPAYHIRQSDTFIVQKLLTAFPLDIHAADTVHLQLPVQVPELPGTYDLLFSIGTDWYIGYFGTNGKWLRLTVTD